MSDTESDLEPESYHLELSQDQEWEDVEDDVEDVTFISLFDDRKFTNIQEMLRHCKAEHDFDIWKLRKDLQLQDLDLIKLINYVRSVVRDHKDPPSVTSRTEFEDDRYLKPILEDDAVLYSLEDAFDDEDPPTANGSNPQAEIEALRRQLSDLQVQFATYRNDVQTSLLQDISRSESEQPQSASADSTQRPILDHHSKSQSERALDTADKQYFDSYDYTSIHHIMLSDHIRTSAYRDFIYSNKHLFQSKIVLDVGCGTGILSLFAATAGARLVIAVDNSSIIEKAKENIEANNLSNRIICVRGKIEDIALPLPADAHGKVDIIISEWMGYALLYESMLDSIIHARDKYLSPNGLMVPSHTTINMSPLADSNLRIDNIDFWRDVYSFDFSAMLNGAFSDALIRTVSKDDIAGGIKDAVQIVAFDLHKVSVSDLSFTRPFEMSWRSGHDRLEGWVVWFDMFFAESSTALEGVLSIEAAEKRGVTCFSTSPFTPTTHWEQVVLMIENLHQGRNLMSGGSKTADRTAASSAEEGRAIEEKLNSQPADPEQQLRTQEGWFASGPKLEESDTIKGVLKYEKHAERERSLTISVDWEVSGKIPRFGQTWHLD